MIELGVIETRCFELFTGIGISYVAMTGGYAGAKAYFEGGFPDGHSTWIWSGQRRGTTNKSVLRMKDAGMANHKARRE